MEIKRRHKDMESHLLLTLTSHSVCPLPLYPHTLHCLPVWLHHITYTHRRPCRMHFTQFSGVPCCIIIIRTFNALAFGGLHLQHSIITFFCLRTLFPDPRRVFSHLPIPYIGSQYTPHLLFPTDPPALPSYPLRTGMPAGWFPLVVVWTFPVGLAICVFLLPLLLLPAAVALGATTFEPPHAMPVPRTPIVCAPEGLFTHICGIPLCRLPHMQP